MNYVDEKYREAMWKNKIPVKIEMAIEDISDVEKPPSFYYNIPRIGYIANLIKEVKSNFENFLPLTSPLEDVWFEVNKVPLKWHIPFGVLLDGISGGEYELPINIIAHFRSFPENQLVRYKGMESLKFTYLNALKEANTLKYGSSHDVLNLPTNQTLKLLNIVFNDGNKSIKEYDEITLKFLDKEIDNIKKLPIKIVFNKTDVAMNKPFILGDYSFNHYENYTLDDYLRDYLTEEVYESIRDKIVVLIHGIEVDLSLPLLFIHSNFSYMDNFLYITLSYKKIK